MDCKECTNETLILLNKMEEDRLVLIEYIKRKMSFANSRIIGCRSGKTMASEEIRILNDILERIEAQWAIYGFGFDLDGVLAHYEENQEYKYGITYIGAPIPEMIELLINEVNRGRTEGYTVKIFTARANRSDYSYVSQYFEMIKAIDRFCLENFGVTLAITPCKDKYLIKFYDDKAVQVIINEGKIIIWKNFNSFGGV